MNTMLSDDEIRDHIYAIIARQAKIDFATLRPDATLKDLGVASLEAIELIFDIEEHFDINFPDGNANFDTDTVQSLVDAVRIAMAAKHGGAGAAA